LELERAEEVRANAEGKVRVSNKELSASGKSLTRLAVSDRRTGLYGRSLVTFQRSGGSGAELPPHRFTPRDIVQLGAGRGGGGGGGSGGGVSGGSSGSGGGGDADAVTGVVYRVRPDSITVAFDGDAASDDRLSDGGGGGGTVSLLKLFNETTYRRYDAALSALSGAKVTTTVAGSVVDVLFGRAEPRTHAQPAAWAPMSTGLNTVQVSN
jgi:ATP-dependent RNA/DNA helicase IGHMBP2